MLIPFGLFGKSAFMAERVLGNVISSGIKVLVLAVIIGIGSTLFSEFTAGFGGATPTIDEAMAIVLAALSLLGLGIFGPALPAASCRAARSSVRAPPSAPSRCRRHGCGRRGNSWRRRLRRPSLLGGAAAAARGGAALAGGASTAYSLGAAGETGVSAVSSGAMSHRRARAAVSPLKKAAGRASESLKSSYQSGACRLRGQWRIDNRRHRRRRCAGSRVGLRLSIRKPRLPRSA